MQQALYMPQLLAWANAEAAGMRVARVATIVIFRLARRIRGSFEVEIHNNAVKGET
jgi:hypothetical protein